MSDLQVKVKDLRNKSCYKTSVKVLKGVFQASYAVLQYYLTKKYIFFISAQKHILCLLILMGVY